MMRSRRQTARRGGAPAQAARALFGAALLALVLMAAGCAGESGGAAQASAVRSFTAMDTGMSLTVSATDQKAADEAADACVERVRELDALLSPEGGQSQISILNGAGGDATPVREDLLPLFATARAVAQETDGAFDPTVYPLTSAWGFTDGAYRAPSDEELDALLPRVGYERLHVDASARTVALESDARMDVGGVAKGFAADELRALLAERGATSALLDLGGNVTALGSKPDGSPWKVGVADPAAPDQLAGTLELTDATASTSGDYQRFFVDDAGVRHHHLLDPATGRPAESGLASVTVVGPDGARCDALSTALFVMGLDRAVDAWRAAAASGESGGAFEAVLIESDGTMHVTAGLAEAFSPSEGFAERMAVVPR